MKNTDFLFAQEMNLGEHMTTRKDIASQIGRKQFPELNEVIEIRDILMGAVKIIVPEYKHEGSGAGMGAADFSFILDGKIFQITVEEVK